MAGRNGSDEARPDYDVVVVGAGFAGLYLLRGSAGSASRLVVLESADDVGGTWYWNRYPGARCDIPTTDYTYSLDPDLEREWTWSEKYATQPEILSLPPARRREVRPAPRHRLLDPGRRRRRGTTPASRLAGAHRHRRRHLLPLLRHGDRLPVDAEGGRHRRRRAVRGRGVLHQPLAARGRRLHRQAGRGHRHRLVGHPVHPDHRRAGRGARPSSSARPNFSLPAHNGPLRPERLAAHRSRP